MRTMRQYGLGCVNSGTGAKSGGKPGWREPLGCERPHTENFAQQAQESARPAVQWFRTRVTPNSVPGLRWGRLDGPERVAAVNNDGGALEALSDEALMAEIAAGNRPAFTVLSRRHLKRSLALAQRIAGSASDAEEIVQDAFLGVWRHADGWRGGEANFTTWLYRIVVNRSLDYRRRRGFAPIEEVEDLPAPAPDPYAVVAEQQLAASVDVAIAALPDRQRAALSLCYYQELSCAEAADVLQVSVSAMESLLVRARRVLRAKLHHLIGPAGEEQS